MNSKNGSKVGVKPAAIMSREGLGHFVEITGSGRQLVKTVRRSLYMTVAGSVLGLLIVFFRSGTLGLRLGFGWKHHIFHGVVGGGGGFIIGCNDGQIIADTPY